jgi:S-(hydroxymethyl)glutathione dehydrogenase/alcohol dehydrogenase
MAGSQGGESLPHEDIPRYHNLFNAGRIKLSELITEKVALDGINDAIGLMRSGEMSGRVLITFSVV